MEGGGGRKGSIDVAVFVFASARRRREMLFCFSQATPFAKKPFANVSVPSATNGTAPKKQ